LAQRTARRETIGRRLHAVGAIRIAANPR
jgi:hypothetical protein